MNITNGINNIINIYKESNYEVVRYNFNYNNHKVSLFYSSLHGLDTQIHIKFYIDKNQSYEKKSIDVHTLAEVVDYIPLETPDDGLIPKSDTRVESILATATEVFIVSLNKIFRFGRNGKFLNTIGRIGEGPQEYVTLIDMVLNRTKKEVIIYDGGKQSLMIYAYDGSFLRSIPLNPNWAVRIGLLDEKTICAVNVPNKNVPGFFLISLENDRSPFQALSGT